MNIKMALGTIALDYPSQAAAARAHGITPAMWDRIRRGKQTPTTRTLKKLGLKVAYEFDSSDRGGTGAAVAHVADDQTSELSRAFLGGRDDSVQDIPPELESHSGRAHS